jgi:hypothetical protein
MNQVIELTGITLDQFKTRRYINDALSILSSMYDTANIKATTTITCTDIVNEYSLPTECFGVVRVKLNGYKYHDYTIEDNLITFEDKGTFEVKYIVSPDLDSVKIYQKELGNDIPPVHEAYHRAICFYVAAQLLDVNDPKAVLLNNKFTSICEDVNNKLKRQKRKGARVHAPLFR